MLNINRVNSCPTLGVKILQWSNREKGELRHRSEEGKAGRIFYYEYEAGFLLKMLSILEYTYLDNL